MSKLMSMESLVVPSISETITAFLFIRAFTKLDFPAFVLPAITMRKPFLRRSLTLFPFRCSSISHFTLNTVFKISAYRFSGIFSSGKSI